MMQLRPQSVPPREKSIENDICHGSQGVADRADESRKRSGPRSPSSRSSFTSRPTANVHAGRRRNYQLVPLCRSTADKETPNDISRFLIRTYTRSFPRSSSRHVQHRFRRGPAQGRDHHPHLGQCRILCCLVTRGANLSLSETPRQLHRHLFPASRARPGRLAWGCWTHTDPSSTSHNSTSCLNSSGIRSRPAT